MVAAGGGDGDKRGDNRRSAQVELLELAFGLDMGVTEENVSLASGLNPGWVAVPFTQTGNWTEGLQASGLGCV